MNRAEEWCFGSNKTYERLVPAFQEEFIRAHRKRNELAGFFGSSMLTEEEASSFIKNVVLMMDGQTWPSAKRYFRSDGSVIAETTCTDYEELERQKSPILVMSEQQVLELEKWRSDIM